MTEAEPPATPAVIFAPHGRDAAIAHAMLTGAGIEATICADLRDFENRLDERASFAVIAEEALHGVDLGGIRARLLAQPAWSDVPLIILTRRVSTWQRPPLSVPLTDTTGNITLLERPFHPETFISVAQTASRGRQRQFEARKRMEELHEGEERLRTALLAGRLGSWELDLKSRELSASPVCKAVFGRAADVPFGYHELLEATHPPDRRLLREAVAAAVGARGECAVEFRNIWPDGSTHWAEIRARVVRDSTARLLRLVGVSSDITDRKESQQALTALNEVLEERVAERTAELTAAHAAVLAEIEHRKRAEEQLRQAQKMETIGQLTGSVAHDFNNLLMAVLGNLELIRKHVSDNPKVLRLLDGAWQGAQRGAALTQRLLAFARRQDLKVEPKNLSDLIRGAADLIERSAGSEIELRLDLPDDLPLALVDTNQIELAVLNLVVNARDAMPEGGVLSIAIDHQQVPASADLPAGHYLRLTVSDTGEGMDAATLQKATEPFFSTKELGKGTGLGLSMVHGLAVQLNGALRLTSETGRGTRAELWLPVTSLLAINEPASAAGPLPPKADRLTILVVDDDALIAMSTVDMLEDLGHEVIEAHSGEHALEILGNGQLVDILVTDFSMPKMNGAQLAMAARQLRPELPILLATGYAELPPGSGIDLPRIGKPYQQEQLAAEIVKLLGEGVPRAVH
ncbi:ATP-binding protein [Ancylobacter sp.]|uniref:ATP-binding protein n=1 Tax=Ancylobacter sp. TaxID=1872567 RepID=UPI003D14A0A7